MSKQFLHRHPQLEELAKLDKYHVIVDIEDWKEAKEVYKRSKVKMIEGIVKSNPPTISGGLYHGMLSCEALTQIQHEEDMISAQIKLESEGKSTPKQRHGFMKKFLKYISVSPPNGNIY